MTQPLLVAEALCYRFGDLEALRGLELQVHEGEIFGLVGPDGAGKTTAIRLMTGVMRPFSGRVLVLGHDPMGGQSVVRDNLGYMPQQYSLYGDLTVEENLDFFAAMFSVKREAYRQRREHLLAMTRLSRFVGRRADALSGGMYKKLALACALLHRPRLLILDEPTNGVDPVSRREFWDLLGDFSRQGMAIVLSTPYMDEAARCHRVGLMHQGRLLTEGEPRRLLREIRCVVGRVEGGERGKVLGLLEGAAGVIALSPAGARIRVVFEPQVQVWVAERLEEVGARLVLTPADFEDVFLVRLHQAEGEPT
ncbi:ABC transporter ATP-binding protein [Myxococcota bacterium]